MKKSGFLIFVIVILFLYAFCIEPSLLFVKEYEINNQPKILSGMKIAIITDLHLGRKFITPKKLDYIVKLVNKQNPNIIFFLGDLDPLSMYEAHFSEGSAIESLSDLNAPLGKFAVLGNHDYEPENIAKDILNKSNFIILEDEVFNLKYKGEVIQIIGLKDLWWGGDIFNIKYNNSLTTILLSHNPDIFPKVKNFADLTLAGHTHGGEVSISLIGPLYVPSKYHQKYAKGIITENNHTLFVSSGIGTLSQFRFCNPPEISILKLF